MGNNCIVAQIQRIYTVEEVAKILGISIRQAYYLCEMTNDFIR